VVEIVEARGLGTEPIRDLERHRFPFGRVWRQQDQPLRRGGRLDVLPPVGGHVRNRRAVEVEDALTHRLVVRRTDGFCLADRDARARQSGGRAIGILGSGLTHRLQQLLADAGGLQSVDALGPLEPRVKEGCHVDCVAAQRNIESGGNAQGDERSHVMADQIDRLLDPP
jgi:hypothetical protein